MRRLIVNADDFGLSHSANEAIIRAHCEGMLTTTSLMVNEAGFAEAVGLAREHPRLGIGLHLALVDAHATLAREQIPDLVKTGGRCRGDPARAGFRYFFGARIRDQLRAEIAAQFAKFRATGLPLDHVNSHHHLHMHPTIMGLLLENASAWGITHLRITREPFSIHARTGVRAAWARRLDASFHAILAQRARPRCEALKLRSPRWVFGVLRSGQVDETYISHLLPVLPEDDCELYSHPSLDQFKPELEALISPRVNKLISQLGIQLIRYQDL